MLNEEIDFPDQFFDTTERTSADRTLRDESKPALDLIQPRRVRGSVVDFVAGRCASQARTFGCLWVA